MLVRKLLFRNLFCIPVLVVASFHSAYGQNRPNHKDALNQIKNMLSDDSILEITKLVYVNGTQTDINHYLVAVTYTKVFKVSSKTLFDKDGMPLKNPANAAEGASTILSYLVNAGSGNLFGPFEPGDSFDMSCQFIFVGTENGWILQGPQTIEAIVKRNTGHTAINADNNKSPRQLAYAKMFAERVNACQSGKQLKAIVDYSAYVVGDPAPLVKVWRALVPFDPNNPVLVGKLNNGQVVVGVPDPNAPKNACHVQYTVDGKTFSGYVAVASLVTVP